MTKEKIQPWLATLTGLAIVLALFSIPHVGGRLLAADGEGGLTETKGRAASYFEDKQTVPFYQGLDGTGSIADVNTDTDTYLFRLIQKSTTSGTGQDEIKGSVSRTPRQNVSVTLHFTNAGATAQCYLVYYRVTYDSAGAVDAVYVLGYDEPFAAGAPSTLDASSVQVVNSYGTRYLSRTYIFDTLGATHCALICTNVSAGTANAWMGSF